MTGVKRGARVTFTAWNDRGTDCAGLEVGTVLDQGPERGEWWVSVPGAANAVRVHARTMTSASNMHGQR